MAELIVLDDQLVARVTEACSNARIAALQAGHYVVYRDSAGHYIKETPEGRLYEIRFDSTLPRESHIIVLRELTPGSD